MIRFYRLMKTKILLNVAFYINYNPLALVVDSSSLNYFIYVRLIMQRNLHDSHILCPSNKCINLHPSGFSILKIKKS